MALRIKQEIESQVIQDYSNELSCKEIAIKYNLNIKSIWVILKRNNIKLENHTNKKLNSQKEQELIKDYLNGMDLKEIESKYNVGYSVRRSTLIKYKIPFRESKNKISKEIELEIIKDYQNKIKVKDIAIKYNVGRCTILYILNEYNIPIRTKHPLKKISIETENKIIELYKNNTNLEEVIKQFNLGSGTLQRILNRNNIKPNRRKIWTQEEENWLIQNYPIYGAKYCATYFNCSKNMIGHKCSNLGIKTNPTWNEKEITYLKENYPLYGLKFCIEKLNKNSITIKNKVSDLKIKFIRTPLIKPTARICLKCKIEKPLKDFHKESGNKTNGVQPRCAECRNLENRISSKIKRKEIAARQKERIKTDILYRLRILLSRNLRSMIKRVNAKKQHKTVELLGCSIASFKAYLESLWLAGMSWENYGLTGWTIDHILPIDSFDLTKKEQQLECFNYKNCRPLWHTTRIARINGDFLNEGNVNKGNKIYDLKIETENPQTFLSADCENTF